MSTTPIFAKVQALILTQLGTTPILDTIDVHAPTRGEVLVRVAAAGICHTDYGYMQYARATPVVLGHEAAGLVLAVGSDVKHVQVGDHVVLNWQVKCGCCRRCLSGRRDLCENIQGTAEPRLYWRGQPLHAMLNTGAFCPYVVVPGGGAVPVRTDVPFTKAALLGCAVATGVGAALYTADVQPGEDVAVIGAGGVGLNVVQGARLANAGRIIVFDQDETKLNLARQLGASHAINVQEHDPILAVREITQWRGVEYVFEAVGYPQLMRQGIDMLARGGALVLIGAAEREAELTFAPRRLMSMQQRILGCIYGNVRPELDLAAFADWYMQGRLHLDELHTQTITLDQLPAFFSNPALRSGLRTVVNLENAI